jgi:hypothetical protein
MPSDARNEAVARLETALVVQDRLGDRYRAAIGTSGEFGSYVRLRTASGEVFAREAGLKAIDDERPGGRVWVNGREVGGPASLFMGLEVSHD